MPAMLWPILWVIFSSGTEVFCQDVYTNVWAVKVRGSRQEAKLLALKHGFSYDKHVSSLFLFAMVNDW